MLCIEICEMWYALDLDLQMCYAPDLEIRYAMKLMDPNLLVRTTISY